MNYFKPEDFYAAIQYSIGAEECKKKIAEKANAKLQELIDKAPVVYGPSSSHVNWNVEQGARDNHKAHLMFIEELSKPECKHEPVNVGGGSGIYYQGNGTGGASFKEIIPSQIKCKYCGVELIAEWRVKEGSR